MRGFWLLVAALIGGVLVWQGRPWLEQRAAPPIEVVPRAITPAGDLAADEKATIELFERSKGSVVFITTTQLVRDFWSRNLFSVPRPPRPRDCAPRAARRKRHRSGGHHHRHRRQGGG